MALLESILEANKNASNANGHAHHRLAWLDQLAYELHRVTGRSQLMQCVWIYDRPVNHEAIAQTYDRFLAQAFNRLIEPALLPWARPRWVKPQGAPEPIAKSSSILQRSELLQWANALARRPIDPVNGPAWRVAVQEFDDGSTAISVVGSHLIMDGMGAVQAIAAAANASSVPGTYAVQGTRGWFRGGLSDAWQTVCDTPQTLAALCKIAVASFKSLSLDRQKSANANHLQQQVMDLSTVVNLAAVTLRIDLQAWEACAVRLGGRRVHTMLPGFVAALASRLGRCRASDGAVSLVIPVDKRQGLQDDRAIAFEFRNMTVAPAGLTKDLRPVIEPLKAVLRSPKDPVDVLGPLLPAIAWFPRTMSTGILKLLFKYADDLPVSCSYLGALPEGVANIDGVPCAQVLMRAVDVNVTRRDLVRSHGHLVVVASQHQQTITLCIEACQLHPEPTTTAELRAVAEQTLAEFSLTASIEA